MFSPKYKLNNKVISRLTSIAEARIIIEKAKLLPKQEINLRRQAVIRMTHNSTGIEGNILSLKQVESIVRGIKIDAPQRDIYEVENYLKTLKYITEIIEKNEPISKRAILRIHKLVTSKTLPKNQSGIYRSGQVYVVSRRLGLPDKIIYTAPQAERVSILMDDLLEWIKKSEKEKINPVIVAGVVHQEIAAIHPFSDGNGRTARALATLILYKMGYDFRKLFALEDYYNKDRQSYYNAINIGSNYDHRKVDFTPWLEYFIKGFNEEIEKVKKTVINLSLKRVGENINSKIYLDENQLKIIDFLESMGRITVKDVIDILNCSRRKAQLEMQKLKKIKMISQVGKGPASAYILAK
ncbi:MAG: Dot/Icm type IV secretion system effector CoxFIC1 [Candidatus Microsyncoccus archaeolyticus]|nr:MAG: Dot/Icm type IV secretion system effector CoxFIC1 [Candidatus Parcubacteria bacterium]